MLFNSLDFAIFLPLVFILYWFVFTRRYSQNILLVAASYIFYGWWDPRFLLLIFFSTVLDFTIALKLKSASGKNYRRLLLWISIVANLGLLGFFKYYNFFIDNFTEAFSFLGADIGVSSLNIVLPVGISFYTFQTLSYTIDVYKQKLKPSGDFIVFCAFVSFFPQLVAGPIERATNLLPQFFQNRKFDFKKAVLGVRQILWGLFKKIVIADNCAEVANFVFNNSEEYSGFTLVLGALFFTIQIYGDFSGYSDIAIGTSRLFGFELMQNFAYPYFSRDVAEFWRRWHISLSTWFRDYVYIPLGGSKGSTWSRVRNTFIIFTLSGFWHGANWTFIVWGVLNAMYFLPLLLSNRNRKNIDISAKNRFFPDIKEFAAILGTFSLTAFTWIFFRAENLSHSISYIYNMFSGLTNIYTYKQATGVLRYQIGAGPLILIIVFFIIEWSGREHKFAIQNLHILQTRWFRWLFYIVIALTIFIYQGKEQEFIYFQF